MTRQGSGPGHELDGVRPPLTHEPLLVLLTLPLALAALFVAWGGWNLLPEIRIALGFGLFFIAPGWLLKCLIFPYRSLRLFERIPVSIALSLGVWAFPGLIAYRLEMSLQSVAVMEIAIIFVLFVLALAARSVPYFLDAAEPGPARINHAAVLAVTLGLMALAAWTGAFRGAVLDWDYFNYISAVNKLLAWGKASIAHYAYLGVPPDPIHSYNVWALEWALVARLYRLGPIELYARSAFITIPAAALSFYSLGTRLLGPVPGRTSFLLFVSYHVIYGGLLFLGRTTFYPDDSMWLIVFPACLVMLTALVQVKEPGCLWFFEVFFGLGLAALGMSIVHVMWGLCFYLIASVLLLSLAFERYDLWVAIGAAWRQGKKSALVAGFALFGLPLVLFLADALRMYARNDLDGFTPLLGGGLDLSSWTYAWIFIAIPALLLLAAVWPYRRKKAGADRPGLIIVMVGACIGACLLAAVPYIVLRLSTIHATAWEQFGRNPYRAFITSGLFSLNPFQLSLANPNMTFYPLYLLGYAALPVLFALSRLNKNSTGAALFPSRQAAGSSNPGPAIVLCALLAVPVICFHPVFATLFADHFSLGYLRRLLRLMALFAVFPAALLIHSVAGMFASEEKRPVLHVAVSLVLCVAAALACVPFPARPAYYNHIARKTIAITRAYPKDSLIYDDAPYIAIGSHGWFKHDDVIFSDVWTSYRLTAYLPQFVAVREKPGTGVADQDERMLLESEFFDTRTSLARMREILDRFHAAGVIVNRDPTYHVYNYNCGHPEAVGKLKSDPSHFEVLYDKGDWAIFRYKAGN